MKVSHGDGGLSTTELEKSLTKEDTGIYIGAQLHEEKKKRIPSLIMIMQSQLPKRSMQNFIFFIERSRIFSDKHPSPRIIQFYGSVITDLGLHVYMLSAWLHPMEKKSSLISSMLIEAMIWIVYQMLKRAVRCGVPRNSRY